jgi:ferritin-like metal-binding protein YciE
MAEDATALYLDGLRNAHAVEALATEIIERQLERIQNYPEVEQALRTHLSETKRQSERLEAILQSHNATASGLKASWMAMAGNAAAMFHGMMQDEIVKNHFSNVAVESYERAMYSSLITLAEEAGDHAALDSLQQSLREEEKTETLLQDMTRALTTKYTARMLAGVKAGL